MSVPATTVATATVQHSRAAGGTTLAAVPTSAIAVVTAQQPAGGAGSQTTSTMPTVTLTQQQTHQTVAVTQAQQPAIVKHVQEVIMSPQRTTIPIQSSTGVVGQLKSIPTAGQVRQVTADAALQPGTRQVAVTGAPAGVAGVTIHQVPTIAATTGTAQQVKTQQSIALQQAVQQVQAHAQAQQQTQQQQQQQRPHVLQAVTGAGLASAAGAGGGGAATAGSGGVQATVTGTLQPGTATQAATGIVDQSKTQYSLRLRNQPTTK